MESIVVEFAKGGVLWGLSLAEGLMCAELFRVIVEFSANYGQCVFCGKDTMKRCGIEGWTITSDGKMNSK